MLPPKIVYDQVQTREEKKKKHAFFAQQKKKKKENERSVENIVLAELRV